MVKSCKIRVGACVIWLGLDPALVQIRVLRFNLCLTSFLSTFFKETHGATTIFARKELITLTMWKQSFFIKDTQRCSAIEKVAKVLMYSFKRKKSQGS